MFKSKRFVAVCIALLLFILMTYTTTHSPLEIAGGISTIAGIYIISQTYRGSKDENVNDV